jgi:hypothetical protein
VKRLKGRRALSARPSHSMYSAICLRRKRFLPASASIRSEHESEEHQGIHDYIKDGLQEIYEQQKHSAYSIGSHIVEVRKQKPRRASDAIRFTMAQLSRFFEWR